MDIKYYFKNIDTLGESEREYIEKKINSISELIKIEKVKVEIEKQKVFYHMSIQLDCVKDVFYAKEEDKLINACIDKIEDELKKQVRRTKKKNKDLLERGGRSLKKKMVVDKEARF